MATKLSEGNRALLQTEDSHDDDEAEETLSLSDLPLYSTSSSIIHHAAPASTNQKHRRHQEDFEFFSEDFTASTRRMPPDTIVFCGKIIHPYREPPEQQNDLIKSRRGGLFQWKSDSWLTKSKPRKVSTAAKTSMSMSPPASDKCEFLVEKVSVQYSSKSSLYSSKWYLFGLGSKLPAEMGLRDIKTRQSRLRGGAFRTRNGHAGETMKGSGGFWGLLTSLRCRTSRHLPI